MHEHDVASPEHPYGQNPTVLSRLLGISLRRWLIGSLIVWTLACVLLVFIAQDRARSARSGLVALDTDNVTAIDLTEASASVDDAAGKLDLAVWSLESPLLWPLRPLPVIGRQLDSARHIAVASLDVVTSVEPIMAEAERARTNTTQIDRVEFLGEIGRQFGDLERVLDQLDLGPTDGLLPPLVDARNELALKVADLSEFAGTGRVASSGTASFLDKGDYLLLAANNAEMRIGSGMYLSVGVMENRDGAVSIPGLTPSEDIDPVPRSVIVDEYVRNRWGSIDPTTDFRKISVTPRFADFTAPQAIRMWKRETGQDVDGVMQIDPFVFQALLEVLGPVTVGDATITADNALSYLLIDQYEQYRTSADADARREVNSQLTSKLAARMQEGGWDPLALVQAMAPLVEGRHLLAYSVDPEQQAVWESLGMDGRVEGDEVGAFLLNNGASKLDPFMDMAVDVDVEPSGEFNHVTMSVHIASRASATLSEYALGSVEILGVSTPGAYLGRFAAIVPGAASNVEITSGESLEVLGPDGPLWSLATPVFEIGPGATRVIVVEFDLPSSIEVVTALPSTRFPSITWNTRSSSFTDEAPVTFTLATGEIADEDS